MNTDKGKFRVPLLSGARRSRRVLSESTRPSALPNHLPMRAKSGLKAALLFGARRLRRFELGSERVRELSKVSSFLRREDSCRLQPKATPTAGFSLVETVCAVLILGVALTGLVEGVTTGLSSNKESELQTVAALFAAGQMETVRAEGDLRDGTTEGDCGEGLSLYHWRQTISPAGIDGLHEVTVVVESAKSGKAIYELKTLLFEVPDNSLSSSANSRRDNGSQRRRSGSR